jgi:hypothetical protein
MALVTRASDAQIDAISAMKAPQLSGDIYAGEALDACAPCYIKAADGKAYMSNATANDAAAHVDGWTPKAYAIGQPVTLYGPGVRMRYSAAGLTIAAVLYVGATAGRLDTAATTGDTIGVAKVFDTSHIITLRFKTGAAA